MIETGIRNEALFFRFSLDEEYWGMIDICYLETQYNIII